MSAELIKNLKLTVNETGIQPISIIVKKNNSREIELSTTQVQQLITNINNFSYYKTLSDADKKSIFDLSIRYIVRMHENSKGVFLNLYSTTVNFVDTRSTTLCKVDTEHHYSHVTYDSKFKNVDIRNITVPRVDYLVYDCEHIHHCDCAYLNLPKIDFQKSIIVSNNRSDYITLTPEMYKKYLTILPCFVFKHKYISYKTLEINYNKYLVDYCSRITPPKCNKFWACIDQHKLIISDTRSEDSFAFIKDTKDIFKHVHISICEYITFNIDNCEINFKAIRNKLKKIDINCDMMFSFYDVDCV